MPGVPTIFTAILNAPDLAKYDLSSLQFCISGGAPLPIELARAFDREDRLRACSRVTASANARRGLHQPGLGPGPAGSVGLPYPGTVVEIRVREIRRAGSCRQAKRAKSASPAPR